jgi:hypothetical protein
MDLNGILFILFFYLYLTRQVSQEQILIFNDSLGTGKLPFQGQDDRFVPCQLGDLNLQPFSY